MSFNSSPPNTSLLLGEMLYVPAGVFPSWAPHPLTQSVQDDFYSVASTCQLWLGQVSSLAIAVGIIAHQFRTQVPLFRILISLINSVEHVDFNTRLES